ncbi:MAG: ABC transporter permease [Clostridia bacterium]|nr:ABC transporter permease [Clostridia bacterium]
MKLKDYIRNDLNLAKKTLVFNKKKFVCFAIVLLLVQILFSSVLMIQYNYGHNQEKFLEEKYTNDQGEVFHIRLRNLDDVQYSQLRLLELSQTEEDVYFKIAGGKISSYELETGSSFKIYDIDIHFITEITGMSLRKCYDRFVSDCYADLRSEGDFEEFVTPLLNYKLREIPTAILNVLIIVLIFAISFASLWAMHFSNLSYHKFTYGIYTGTGATFARLFFTAVWEMIILNAVVFIPSTLIATAVSVLVVIFNSGFTFWLGGVLISLLLSFTASLIVVFVDYKKVASTEPVNLLRTSDNSDIVSSPRTSEPAFLLYTFPDKTEILSLKRYRKYIFKLIFSTSLLVSVFIGVITLSGIYKQSLNNPREDFSVSFTPRIRYEEREVTIYGSDDPESENYGKEDQTITVVTEIKEYDYSFDEELESELISSGMVAAVDKSCSVTAGEINSHVIFPSKSVKKAASGVKIGDGIGLYNVEFCAFDSYVINTFDFYGYKIKGSLADVLENSDMIAVSDSINNKSAFKLKVGDKIRIAYLSDDRYVELDPLELELAGYDDVLSLLLTKYAYGYREYTVGAIIEGMPSDSRFQIYIGKSAYKKITGQNPVFDRAEIYMASDASDEDVETVGRFLRNSQTYYLNMTVTDLDTRTTVQTEKNKNYYSVYILISVMFLLISPLIWVVSQQLFYDKRSNEFTVFQSLGSPLSEIRSLLVTDAVSFSVIGCTSALILSVIMNNLVNRLMNVPAFYMLITGESSVTRFDYYLPWLAFLIGISVTLLSSLFSIYIAYRSYRNNCSSVFGDGGEDSETEKNEVLYGNDN